MRSSYLGAVVVGLITLSSPVASQYPQPRPPPVPTAAPTPAPLVDASPVPAPAPAAPGGILTIVAGLTLEILDNGNNTATFTLVYEGEGWVALGVSPTGLMVGSQAVLALPDSGEAPKIYDLNSKSDAGVVAAGSDQQILMPSSVTQKDGNTTLIFTVPLDSSSPFSIATTGKTGYIYAYGSSNELGMHLKMGETSATLQGEPGGSANPLPSPAPVDAAPSPAPGLAPSGIIELDEYLTLQSVDNGDTTATFTLVYQGEAWIGFGVSPGAMVGSQAVLALPDSGKVPQIYNLNSQDVSGVVPAGSDQQILTSSSVTQKDGVTTLIFTVPLDTNGPFSIATTGETGYIYAYGSSNVLGIHAKQDAFSATLQGEVSRVNASGKYKAHGWIMSIAWGIFVPLAIGASMLRDLCPGPPGTFFKIHRTLNTMAIVLVIIGFTLAIAAVEAEGLSHFSQNKHRMAGIVIFTFALAQGLNGYLRPHLPHTPDADADADKDATVIDNAEEGENHMTDEPTKKTAEEKSSARKIWEVGHRLLGFGLLATSWWNCITGIQFFNLKFPDMADPNLTNIFLGVVLGLTGVIFLAYVGQKVMKKRQ